MGQLDRQTDHVWHEVHVPESLALVLDNLEPEERLEILHEIMKWAGYE